MEISGLLPLLIPFTLLGGVQEPGLVEGFLNGVCPKTKIPCKIEEINQCSKRKPCPEDMKCCKFNCAKKCVTPKEDICSLPQVVGPCFAFIRRWSYDKKTQACSEFMYGGCQGNNNNFQSESACKAFCVKKCEYSQDNQMLF